MELRTPRDELRSRPEINETPAHQVEVDVPFEESQSVRQFVEELMFPCRTVMDLVRIRPFSLLRQPPDGKAFLTFTLESGDRALLRVRGGRHDP